MMTSDDLFPARPHELLRFLLELVERTDEELAYRLQIERTLQNQQDDRAPLPKSNILAPGIVEEELV